MVRIAVLATWNCDGTSQPQLVTSPELPTNLRSRSSRLAANQRVRCSKRS